LACPPGVKLAGNRVLFTWKGMAFRKFHFYDKPTIRPRELRMGKPFGVTRD